MERFNVGIIGCGGIHKTHARVLREMPDVKINAVADIIPERAAESGKENDCRFYTDYRELLADPKIDAVHITTPHHLHVPMAMDALKAGKHVLLEKPLGSSLCEAERLVRYAETEPAAKGKKIGISFQNRHNPCSQLIKSIVENESYGRLKGIKAQVTWVREKPYYTESGWRGFFATEGGGVLINQSIHTLDLLQWLTGKELIGLKASVATRDHDYIEVEDTAEATIWFEGGVRGLFYATTCYCEDSPVEIDLSFENGDLKLWNDQLYELKEGRVRLLLDREDAVNEQKAYWGTGHGKLIQAFYRSIAEDDDSLNISPRAALVTMKMIDAIYKSSAGGNFIKIDSGRNNS